ncbi:LysE family translocator [Profundibacter sp.]|uniref:LysE family translocator n=1 Tax=Profundibacter sp. TaxID=3101071 RepID=UPI003D142E9D
MPLDLWLAFAAASFVVVVIPGPTILLVVSYALTQGRRVAVATALGVALGDFIAVSLSLAGLGAILLTSAWAFTALKLVGAAYLVFLGIKLLRSPPHLKDVLAPSPTPAKRIFAHSALVTALNPKGIIFILAFVPQFLSADLPVMPQFLTMLATFVGLGAINALAYALLADQLGQRIRSPKVLTWVNRTGGAVLIAMGALTATLQRN